MEYKLSKKLKASIKREMEKAPNRATFHGAISKEVYPDLKRTALLIGNELKLYSNE